MRIRGWAAVSGLSAFALAVHGYHPFGEDGGVYAAGIKRLLDPALYGPHPEFVTEHLRFSLFAPMVAEVVRVSHLPLEWVLLAMYCACLWATLHATWMLAARCTESAWGRCGAVALMACLLTLPIAGTSLMLMDPYLTARSFTTPLVLVAIALALDVVRQWTWWRVGAVGLALAIAAVLHPLMAAYGLAAVLVVLAVGWFGAWRGVLGLGVAAFLIAAAIQVSAPGETAAYVVVERTRYYWFVSEWQWYEQFGLIAPLLILAGFARSGTMSGVSLLARAGVCLGLIAGLVAVEFARTGYSTHLVARLQPLRCFQVVYVLMIVLLGMWIGERWLRGRVWRWVALLGVAGCVMFVVQRTTFPESGQFELAGRAPANAWVRAFVWVRRSTPKDAVFAMDPHYIQAPGEDAQCFRAIAERNALPDYSKDGGEASIMPTLTDAWTAGQIAQNGIDLASDEQRVKALTPLGAGWVVLRVQSATEWACPYANERVKVCRLP